MITIKTSRILLSKVVTIIRPLVHICYLRKFIIVLAKTLVRFIGFSFTENSSRNIIFLVTIGTSMTAFPYLGTYSMESDDVP